MVRETIPVLYLPYFQAMGSPSSPPAVGGDRGVVLSSSPPAESRGWSPWWLWNGASKQPLGGGPAQGWWLVVRRQGATELGGAAVACLFAGVGCCEVLGGDPAPILSSVLERVSRVGD